MSEKAEGPEAGAPSADAVALAAAMTRSSPLVDTELVAYLRDQRSHMHETLKQIHLDIFEKWLGVMLRLATLVVGLGAATGVALMVWDASHSRGLLIEPFAVPPDLAARGLTGQVVASQVQDKLTAMDNATLSYRAPQSYTNNWGNDIKVEIPETGVSIGEFRRFLREWLGSDIHISGEVWRTETGIAISARTSGDTGVTFSGTQSEIDALVQKAAENVFAQTQPYRYANYIRGQRRYDDAYAIYMRLTGSDTAVERGWAWYGIGVLSQNFRPNLDAALWAFHKAVAAYPGLTIAYSGISAIEHGLGHEEAALAALRKCQELLARSSIPDLREKSIPYVRLQWTNAIPFALGDYDAALRQARTGAAMPDQQGFRTQFLRTVFLSLAGQHDAKAARDALRQMPASTLVSVRRMSASTAIGRAVTPMQMEAQLENWRGVLQAEPAAQQTLAALNVSTVSAKQIMDRQIRPWTALAKAKLGDIAGAGVMIAPTPGDCDDCARIRAIVAATGEQPDRADYWFARAVRQAPSIPFSYHDWGRALLARGDADGAIAKFKLANQKGPHFADPLEGWGEALMAKNQSHLALAKFAEAEKYAPNWGRCI